VAPYLKRYGREDNASQDYVGKPDHAAWLAHANAQLAGQILVSENWNLFDITRKKA
jgi:hypothetical protein